MGKEYIVEKPFYTISITKQRVQVIFPDSSHIYLDRYKTPGNITYQKLTNLAPFYTNDEGVFVLHDGSVLEKVGFNFMLQLPEATYKIPANITEYFHIDGIEYILPGYEATEFTLYVPTNLSRIRNAATISKLTTTLQGTFSMKFFQFLELEPTGSLLESYTYKGEALLNTAYSEVDFIL